MPNAARPLEGRVCMVTGATSGIGAVTVRALARLGAEVVVVGRDPGRCARQVRRIRREAPGARAEPLVADLSSQAQLRALASRFRDRHDRLDVLVHNAGAMFVHRQLTVDGLERTFALNHLAPFMLTLLLLESLRASGSARVVNVSSSAHVGRTLDLDDLQGERGYDMIDAYGRSKLANVLFTYELARRLEGARVTANALDPGFVATNLGIDRGWLRVRMRNLLRSAYVSPEEGARTSIHLASAPELEGITGRYFVGGREVRSSEASYDAAAAARLWDASEALSGVRWAAPGSGRPGWAARPASPGAERGA